MAWSSGGDLMGAERTSRLNAQPLFDAHPVEQVIALSGHNSQCLRWSCSHVTVANATFIITCPHLVSAGNGQRVDDSIGLHSIKVTAPACVESLTNVEVTVQYQYATVHQIGHLSWIRKYCFVHANNDHADGNEEFQHLGCGSSVVDDFVQWFPWLVPCGIPPEQAVNNDHVEDTSRYE